MPATAVSANGEPVVSLSEDVLRRRLKYVDRLLLSRAVSAFKEFEQAKFALRYSIDGPHRTNEEVDEMIAEEIERRHYYDACG